MAEAGEEQRSNMGKRLRAAQRDVGEKEDAYRASLQLRRELIFEAIDADGMSTREVALALGLTQSRVSAILGEGAA